MTIPYNAGFRNMRNYFLSAIFLVNSDEDKIR